MVYAMDDFARRLTSAMTARGIGVRALARRVHCDPALISRLAAGKQSPSPKIASLLDDVLGAAGTLARTEPGHLLPDRAETGPGDEIAAIEVTRRTYTTDVGDVTVGRLEQAVDDLALAYPRTPPADLLGRVRGYLDYTSGLFDRRVTLGEHRRILVSTGWLSLLSATCLIDLRRSVRRTPTSGPPRSFPGRPGTRRSRRGASKRRLGS